MLNAKKKGAEMANKEIKRPASAATESGPDSKVSNNNSSRLSAEKQGAKKYFSEK